MLFLLPLLGNTYLLQLAVLPRTCSFVGAQIPTHNNHASEKMWFHQRQQKVRFKGVIVLWSNSHSYPLRKSKRSWKTGCFIQSYSVKWWPDASTAPPCIISVFWCLLTWTLWKILSSRWRQIHTVESASTRKSSSSTIYLLHISKLASPSLRLSPVKWGMCVIRIRINQDVMWEWTEKIHRKHTTVFWLHGKCFSSLELSGLKHVGSHLINDIQKSVKCILT